MAQRQIAKFSLYALRYTLYPWIMRPIILIPARLAATRLPNKPLLPIAGKPMIEHVYAGAQASKLGAVCVAAGDQEIVDHIRGIGGQAVLTDPDLPSGSDRIWAALQAVDPAGQYDTIINLQGDLPKIAPDLLPQILRLLDDPAVDIATAVTPIADPADIAKPNVVKAALTLHGPAAGRALYFSRSAIPHGAAVFYHHIGIYIYKRAALARFITAPPADLELTEKLEQLRALSLGMRIDAAIVNEVPLTIDTPEDLERARQVMG
jgi:3-deoxy-manno-octulosonate cytidylyltransferase (CMP-KDO synthetase)